MRDGDQLVGAVMTFLDRRPYDALLQEKEDAERAHAEELERLAEEHGSELTALRQSHVTEVEELQEKHAEELAAYEERYAALGEREKDRYEALAARHDQLLTLLGGSLRGPLDELRRELAALAADDAGQLWPEANQVLHHLSAGYSRITTLIDNVLGYQRLDAGTEQIARTKVMLDAVVAAGVDGAVELIGPGRVQFAVHAPPIEAEVDPRLLATALAHLVADVAGVDATGNTPPVGGRISGQHGRGRGGPARRGRPHRGARPVRRRRPGARAGRARHRPGARRCPADARGARDERQRVRPRGADRRRGGRRAGPAAGRGGARRGGRRSRRAGVERRTAPGATCVRRRLPGERHPGR